MTIGKAEGQPAAMTRAEWLAEGERRFGEHKIAWRFRCPACHNVMSVERASVTDPDVKGKGWHVENECIGRYTERVDCDWAAYGLFRGPVLVTCEDGTVIPVFEFDRADKGRG